MQGRLIKKVLKAQVIIMIDLTYMIVSQWLLHHDRFYYDKLTMTGT
jgi:hypothetical protein